MRKAIGLVLLGLFGFLAVTALLMAFVAPGLLKKTPLDVDSETRLTGTAVYLGAPEVPVQALNRTVADGEASDSDVVVFDTFTCVIRNPDGDAPDCLSGDDERTLTLSEDRFATDRRTAEAVDDIKYIGTTSEPHEGLVNKWPFDPEQKTYQYWDGLLGHSVDAVFDGEEEVDGLAAYRYKVSFADQPIEISAGVAGTYTDDKTLWIDKGTGSILDTKEHQLRMLDNGETALDLTLAYTPETVKANVADAKSNNSQLSILGWAPLVLGVLALVALAGGLLLRRSARGTESSG
jgi:hypothetical protein